jgi:predicted NodU family carbamoyl transferase
VSPLYANKLVICRALDAIAAATTTTTSTTAQQQQQQQQQHQQLQQLQLQHSHQPQDLLIHHHGQRVVQELSLDQHHLSHDADAVMNMNESALIWTDIGGSHKEEEMGIDNDSVYGDEPDESDL